jgi:hypothetical protein
MSTAQLHILLSAQPLLNELLQALLIRGWLLHAPLPLRARLLQVRATKLTHLPPIQPAMHTPLQQVPLSMHQAQLTMCTRPQRPSHQPHRNCE